jgi:hypothetical protein
MKLASVPSPPFADGDGDFAQRMLLQATPASMRTHVNDLLSDPRRGGRGLRAWLSIIEVERPALPESLPESLVEIYLSDDEAEPLHDCENCGLAVPVHCGRHAGHEPVAEREYFPVCPSCGGRTGRHAYWSRQA